MTAFGGSGDPVPTRPPSGGTTPSTPCSPTRTPSGSLAANEPQRVLRQQPGECDGPERGDFQPAELSGRLAGDIADGYSARLQMNTRPTNEYMAKNSVLGASAEFKFTVAHRALTMTFVPAGGHWEVINPEAPALEQYRRWVRDDEGIGETLSPTAAVVVQLCPFAVSPPGISSSTIRHMSSRS